MSRKRDERDLFLERRNKRINASRRTAASKRKYRGFRARQEGKRYSPHTPIARPAPTPREILTERVFRVVPYVSQPIRITIDGEFGLETETTIKEFLSKSSEFMDARSRSVVFDLSRCTRMWPSGITLLCSFAQWTGIKSRGLSSRPLIASTAPSAIGVNEYLRDSGFYDYVGVRSSKPGPIKRIVESVGQRHTVRLKRETNLSEIEVREDGIVELLRACSALNADQLELFADVVLVETFANVTEHGVAFSDNGYWILAQEHPTHGFISICIGDNGIGIKNSLISGPQAEDIAKRIGAEENRDGEYLRIALEEPVSGAEEAPVQVRTGFFSKGFPRGARRGKGLKKIRQVCKELGVPLSILSHRGYILVGENGKIVDCGCMPTKVFAGTLYSYKVPTKRYPVYGTPD